MRNHIDNISPLRAAGGQNLTEERGAGRCVGDRIAIKRMKIQDILVYTLYIYIYIYT